MNKMFTFGAAIALLAISGAVLAYPSLLGPSGSGVLPDATTVSAKAYDAAVDYFNNSVGILDISVTTRVNYGIAENTEIGFAYTLQGVRDTATVWPTEAATASSYSYNSWNVSAKRTMAINERMTAGLGVVYQNWNDLLTGDSRSFSQVYSVLGTTLPFAGIPVLHGYIGLNYTKGDAKEEFDSFSDSAIRGFIGLSASVTEKLSVAVDFQTEDSYFDEKPLSSIVARYPINTRMNAQIGMSNAVLGMTGGPAHNLFVGVNMGFGGQGM